MASKVLNVREGGSINSRREKSKYFSGLQNGSDSDPMLDSTLGAEFPVLVRPSLQLKARTLYVRALVIPCIHQLGSIEPLPTRSLR